MKTDLILEAMKADAIPAGCSGLWFVQKINQRIGGYGERNGKLTRLEKGHYTYLRCITNDTIYVQQPGDVVMEDTPYELKTHLGFILKAKGKVLVTGLGLGCVIRGLLMNPAVEHITCIENSKDVLKLVAPYMPTDRLEIIEADALEWTAKNKERFDAAWHDLWTNPDKGEPHLDIWHARLFVNCTNTVKRQGAWAFSREFKTKLMKAGFPWIG